MELRNLDLPQLIVALDSLDDDVNYVHIRDVRENTTYYCPCCKGTVKPRAYKKEQNYQVQPHFYHSDGCCSEESRVHWLYKNWLFKEGSQFYIGETLYSVDFVNIEKSYATSFGLYIPDITVNTKEGKQFFFEINFTNEKKENDYFCKWSELNIDVVEVKVKNFLNQDYNNEIPTFELIYSDGVCYKHEYVKRDLYTSTIGARKLEWKRQDKLNYKMMWEKLDWFWCELQKYKNMKCSVQEVIDSYQELSYEDMLFCWKIIHNHKIKELYKECLRICNAEFEKNLLKENIRMRHIRTYTYEFLIEGDKYINDSCTYITYRKKLKNIELYNEVVEKLYLEQRKLIQQKLLDLELDVLKDIKNIEIYKETYSIIFKSSHRYENALSISYEALLNKNIEEYYEQRKLNRYKKYIENKKQKLLSNENKQYFKHMEYKRNKYNDNINEICSIINNCKNKQWYCTWNWTEKANIKMKLWFSLDKEIKTDTPYYDYDYSLSFVVKEPMFRELKNIITKHMNRLYNLSGIKSFGDYSYNRFGTPECRKLFVNREVNNG